MKINLRLAVVVAFVVGGAFISSSSFASSQTTQDQAKPAEQVFRNIQALKGIPASQLQQIMATFTGALGVKCTHCHTNPFEKDDKPAKQTARRMIQMVLGLNRENFGGRDVVTCFTCHRGNTRPESVLILGRNVFLADSPAPVTPPANLPTVDQILDRYAQAVGGKDVLAKLTTRISRGSRIGADGVLVPEEVYQKAPNKMLVITRYPGVDLTVRLNGQRGWSGDKDRQNEISGEELAELEREATFHKEASLKEMYSAWKSVSKEALGGKEAYVIEATSRTGAREKLYFDAVSGLLLRRYRESKTALGPFPLQIDYDDYQIVDGLKLPLTIRWSMPGRVWARRIAEVKHNTPIEDQQFEPPPGRR